MKEKVLNVLKVILMIALFGIPVALISFNSELVVGDEIWNFQNIAKLVNGGTMYVDCNIIITPIFYLIGYCFVKLITGTILGFRIYNVFIFTALFLSSFALFKSLKMNSIKSFIYTVVVFLFVMPYISTGANYNILAEAFFLLGVVLFINKDKIKFYNICQGIAIFACIFTKQNIGLYYLIAMIISEILIDKKESVHYIIREIMVVLVCSLIAVLIMCGTGCFGGFLNYTVLGMSEFTSENFTLQEGVEIVIIGYLVIALCSYILGILMAKMDKEISNNMKVLITFSILLNLSILPIANLYHTSFAILLNVIIFIDILEKLLFSKLKNKVVLGVIAVCLYIAINSYGIICGYRASKNLQITDKENIYFSSNMSEELNEKIQKVAEYIQEKEKEGIDVICISADSPIYMTYLHKNHQELDLCFQGNLGYHGKENTLEKIQALKNTEILMNQEIYWQEFEDLRIYVIENYENIGTLEDLNIFKVN